MPYILPLSECVLWSSGIWMAHTQDLKHGLGRLRWHNYSLISFLQTLEEDNFKFSQVDSPLSPSISLTLIVAKIRWQIIASYLLHSFVSISTR